MNSNWLLLILLNDILKLIRDKIPEKIKEAGGDYKV